MLQNDQPPKQREGHPRLQAAKMFLARKQRAFDLCTEVARYTLERPEPTTSQVHMLWACLQRLPRTFTGKLNALLRMACNVN